MSRRLLLASVSVLTALLIGSTARAAGRDCTGPDSLQNNPPLEAGKITSGDARVFFLKNAMENKSCPADTKSCRRKAFLVPGNGVVMSGQTDDFACATFVNGKGIETSGWLPKGAVTQEARSATLPWTGSWVRDEAKITIQVDGKSNLAIKGDATYGAHDPDRVKRGGVNVGEISAKIAPKGDRLSFSMGDNDKTLPVDKGDDTTCKVWMQRVGDFLLVDDNNACGGMNVSFRGTYARR